MSKEKTRDALLDTLVEIIAQTADPDQIILFGSRAQGTAGTESDYDFLVVVPGVKNERHVSRRIYRALLDQHVGTAVDVIVVDAAKLAQHRDTPGLIYQHALIEGQTCYDRARIRLTLLIRCHICQVNNTQKGNHLDAYLRASALICVPHPLVESSYWCFLDADFHDARRLKEKISVHLR